MSLIGDQFNPPPSADGGSRFTAISGTVNLDTLNVSTLNCTSGNISTLTSTNSNITDAKLGIVEAEVDIKDRFIKLNSGAEASTLSSITKGFYYGYSNASAGATQYGACAVSSTNDYYLLKNMTSSPPEDGSLATSTRADLYASNGNLSSLNLSSTSNEIKLCDGQTATITISGTKPASTSQTFTLPDGGTNANLTVMVATSALSSTSSCLVPSATAGIMTSKDFATSPVVSTLVARNTSGNISANIYYIGAYSTTGGQISVTAQTSGSQSNFIIPSIPSASASVCCQTGSLASKICVGSANGVLTGLDYSNNATTANTIVQRDANGRIFSSIFYMVGNSGNICQYDAQLGQGRYITISGPTGTDVASGSTGYMFPLLAGTTSSYVVMDRNNQTISGVKDFVNGAKEHYYFYTASGTNQSSSTTTFDCDFCYVNSATVSTQFCGVMATNSGLNYRSFWNGSTTAISVYGNGTNTINGATNPLVVQSSCQAILRMADNACTSDYEVYIHTSEWTGGFLANQSSSLRVVKNKNMVMLRLIDSADSLIATYGSATPIVLNTALPARFRPTRQMEYRIEVYNNSASTQGGLRIETDGVIRIYTADYGGFSTGGDCGFYNTCVSYLID